MADASNGEHIDGGGESLPPVRRSRWDREDLSAAAMQAEVDSVGEGPPVVFLHGLLGLNRHWLKTAERLSSEHRCVMIEAPLLELRGRRCSVGVIVGVGVTVGVSE